MPSPDDICETIVGMGQESFSITDHGSMAGIPAAYRAAKKAGVGFTPGIEAYFTKDKTLKSKDRLGENYYHMILLAHTDEGYHNLVKMQTDAWQKGYYHKPRIDYSSLEQFHKGLTVTTACLGSLINQLFLRDKYDEAKKELGTLIDIFGKENVFMEIQRHGINEQEKILGSQVTLAKEMGIELLATCDSHYCCPDDHDYHDSLLCTSTKAQKHETNRFKFETPNFFLHSGEEMIELFPEKDFPRAVSNTVELAERTDFKLKIDDDKEYIMPKVHTKEGLTEAETLREHVIAGASDPSRYGDADGNIPDHVMERIDYELSVVNNMNFSGYFLIVENLVKLFAKNGIYVGPGRGCLSPETPVYTNKGLIPISDIKEGYQVITESGEVRSVNKVMKHKTVKGEKLISFSNEIGKKIRLTEKHKMLTADPQGNRMWKRAKDVKIGDVIIYCSNNKNKDTFKVNETLHIKDIHWGYIAGASLFSDIVDNKITWKFKDNYIFAETIRNLLDNKNVKYCYEMREGILKEIIIEDEGLNSYFIKNIKEENVFFGLGSTDYSQGFIQAIRCSIDDVPRLSEFSHDNDYILDCLLIASDSIGLQSTKMGKQVNTRYVNRLGGEQRFLIMTKDYVDAPEYVWDISVDGEPSFLTSFGTVHNSAPGSVVVYCLGITNLDPFAHSLFFERFLNPDRISMPDIDIDVPQTKRHHALKLIEEEYGVGHVAHLSNYTMMAMRDTLQRMGKVFGLSPNVANKFCKEIADYCENNGINLKELALQRVPHEVLRKTQVDENVAHRIVKTASKLEGTLTSYGVHASGIVVTSTPIDHNFPIRVSKKAPLPICQYDGADVEALGGVKLDMLGLINLDQCEEAERNILLDLEEEVDTSALALDDPEVYKILSEGRGGGIFQLGCLTGDTIVDGELLEDLYDRRNSTTNANELRSVFLGEGEVKPNKVLDIVYSGDKEVYELWTRKGNNIKATKDHKFFTKRGWLKLEDIDPLNDSILYVQEGIGLKHSHGSVRGREDILHIIKHTNEQLEVVRDKRPITVGNGTFYPDFYSKNDPNKYLIVCPDHAYKNALHIVSEVNLHKFNDTDPYVEAVSYSQVVESIYGVLDGKREPNISLGLPLGTEWDEVTSIDFYGIEKTYDIMMDKPVHNFVANNIMVHNSSGIKSLSRNMQPDTFSDIPALIALYRPGPMGMGTHDEYCKRKNQGAPMEVEHKDMEEILSDTYNLTVYQEDLMALSKHFAGYTGAEADDLRKAVAKKNPVKMEQQKQKFIPAVNKNYGNNLGEKLWNIIEPFGAYAFCKAHSAAYAATTYRTAWLKAYYPAQFAAAVLDHVLDKPDKLIDTIGWIREEGIIVKPPSIVSSELRTITTKDSLTLPLDIIKGLGYNKAEEIINERDDKGQFKSVVDFVARCSPPKKMIISMAKAGCFDELGANRAAVIANVDTIMSVAKTQSSRNELSHGLFGSIFENDEIDDSDLVDTTSAPHDFVEEGVYYIVDEDLYRKWERESVGVILGKHPYVTFKELKGAQSILRKYPPIDTFTKKTDNAKFSGVLMNIVNANGKQTGNPYCSFKIETDKASVSAVKFEHIDEKYEGKIVIVEANIEDDSEGNGEFIPKVMISSNNPNNKFTNRKPSIMKCIEVDKIKERENK